MSCRCELTHPGETSAAASFTRRKVGQECPRNKTPVPLRRDKVQPGVAFMCGNALITLPSQARASRCHFVTSMWLRRASHWVSCVR